VGADNGFGKVLVDEKERKEKNGARSGPPSAKKVEEKKRTEKERREKPQTFAPSRLRNNYHTL